jgi:hypothetical protein
VIGPVLALAAALAAPQAADPVAAAFDARMTQSAQAAQALQGPLDGTWLVRDPRGRVLLVLQISDPANEVGPLAAAWRAPTGPGLGLVREITRSAGRLTIALDDASGLAWTIRLTRSSSGGIWRGRLKRGANEVFDVTLARPA